MPPFQRATAAEHGDVGRIKGWKAQALFCIWGKVRDDSAKLVFSIVEMVF